MIKNINDTPDISFDKSHYFCDYIELIALLNNGDIVSISDIYDRFYDDEKINRESDDRWENRLNEWFSILENRDNVFNKFYPFIVNKSTIKLKFNLTIEHKVYIFLLLNSTQKYISKKKNLLTSDFEELSLFALKKYLPTQSVLYRFSKYSGSLSSKIDLLAQDLKYKTQYEQEDLSTNNSGDGGVDLVSWTPFFNDENQNNMQVVLAQCATGKEWFKKQYETDKFTSNFINFKTRVNNALFIPYDGRRLDRRFTEQKEILNSVWLFDRVRILNLLKDTLDDLLVLKSFKDIVDEIIKYEEDIV